jgi:hypothetical protein
MDWLGTACFAVGFMNSLAIADPSAKKHTSIFSCVIFGIWSLQNFHLVFFTDTFHPIMVLHAISCLIGSLWSGVTSISLRENKSKRK